MIFSLSLLFLFCILILYRKFSRYIPVLMYHRIAAVPGDRNSLPPGKFAEQMAYLYKNGFKTATMQEVYDHYNSGRKLPKKTVLLTFDDGYADNFTAALPILQQYGFHATVFPIGNWIGRENRWEDFHKALTRTMTMEELRLWQAAGMEIASHTMDHPFLSSLSRVQAEKELQQSKALLEASFPPVIDFLCYPYGKFNADTITAAKNAGYKAAFAIFENVPLWHINLFALPRIPIPNRQPLWEFRLKVSSLHMLFIALRQFERFWKKKVRR